MQELTAKRPQRMSRHCALSFLVMSGCAALPAKAVGVRDYLAKSRLSGDLRMYYFSRDFQSAALPDQAAFSLGGRLGLQTAPLAGVNAGLSFFTANPLGLNGGNAAEVDRSLPGATVNVLGEAYVQYRNPLITLRLGNQLVSTPWMNPSDSRMIPAAFQGIYAAVDPTPNLRLVAMRMFRFKGRTADTFSSTNLLSDRNDKGVLSAGVLYRASGVLAQAWYYQFYGFARLFYGDLLYTFHKDHTVAPFVAAQYTREFGDGANYLGKVNTTVYSVMAGLNIGTLGVAVAVSKIPSHPGAYHDGNVLSPYTGHYNTGPIFTNSMMSGMVKKAVGAAYKLSLSYLALHRQLRLLASYAVYHTLPYASNTSETDFDLTWFPRRLKGLSLRDRVGVERGVERTGTFVYNRFMLQYSF